MQTLFSCIFCFVIVLPSTAKELSSEQNNLLNAVNAKPTDISDYTNRTLALWKWVNEFALEGGYVPVNLTQSVSRMLAYPAPNPRQFALIDHYIRELGLVQSDPNAIGNLKAQGGPFVAGEYGTLVQTYTVGTHSIGSGGGIVIARHFIPNMGRYQVDNPTQPNYVTVVSNNPNVELVQDNYRMGGMHGGFRSAIALPFFRVKSGELQSGDSLIITYGDTSEGSPGLRMSDIACDITPFPIYVALDETPALYSLPLQPIEIKGTDIAGVHVFAPSVVKEGEPFEVSIRAQDQYYNRATSAIPGWSLSLNDRVIANVKAGNDAIVVVKIEEPLEPGVYWPHVKGGGFEGAGNPILVEADPARYIYWGDTHGHSGFAEGIGSPDRLMRWAKEDARLDFVSHSEHDIWMDDHEWNVLIDNVQKYSDASFIAYLGYEWTIQNLQGGHHNVLFRTAEGRERVPAQTHGSLTKLYQGLRSKHELHDVIVIPHAHQPGDYRQSDPGLEPLVEIASMHGTFEWFGRMYLRNGHQVGFTAATDDHLAQPGYSSIRGSSLSQATGLGAVLATEKSRDGIFDAMKDLSTYATTGERMILEFSVNGARMGQRIPFTEDRQIQGRIIGTSPIDEITVFKNGETLWTENYRTQQDLTEPQDGTYQLVFQSSSIPYHPYDNPRGRRHWRGTVELIDATLNDARGFNFKNLNPHGIEQDGNILRFQTSTRGNSSSILLELENVSSASTLVINVAESVETGGGPPKVRRHQRVPGSKVELELKNLTDGMVQTTIDLVGYIDHIKLRKVRTDGAKDVTFSLTDKDHMHGDHYYVRVVQANDAIAWSSPIWVGGFASK